MRTARAVGGGLIIAIMSFDGKCTFAAGRYLRQLVA
jgi:hypothetical protein